MKGLFLTERNKRNIERMNETTSSGYERQQHFITDSGWSAFDAMEVTAKKCNARLGPTQQQAYSIDESSVGKSGKSSVGVSSQYNGNLGKVENSQTGVYASLSNRDKVGLINVRLFLPDIWVDDSKRCLKAGVPKEEIVKKSKITLALEMIEQDIARGIEFGWVNADGLYGNSTEFCNGIDDLDKAFVADIHKDKLVYLEDPKPSLPTFEHKKRGHKPKKVTTSKKPLQVCQYMKSLNDSDFKKVKIRKGTKGWIESFLYTKQVWVWDKKEEHGRKRTLIIRRSLNRKETKFALSNLSVEQKTEQEFAFMQSQRYWIERAFQTCKSELGMADYQIRKYRAWYHHQALFFIAMDFANQIKESKKHTIPLLSTTDIRLLLIAYLINDGVKMEKEVEQMIIRHKQRIKDIKRYYPENDFF